jgi:hypothetical protein
MVSVLSVFNLLLAILLPTLVASYKIDDSCIQEYGTLIRDAMTSAFTMARSASTRLDTSPWTTDTAELVDLLFGKEGQHPTPVQMEKTRDIFRAILFNYEDEVTGVQNADVHFQDVVSTEVVMTFSSVRDLIFP